MALFLLPAARYLHKVDSFFRFLISVVPISFANSPRPERHGLQTMGNFSMESDWKQGACGFYSN